MKLSRKTMIGLVVVAAIGYYIYDRNKKGKSLNPFKSFAGKDDSAMGFAAKEDSAFFNAVGGGSMTRRTGCQTYAGNVSLPIGSRLADGRVITDTGRGTTTVCSNITKLSSI